MEYKKLGSSGIEASVIGLGTFVMGGWIWGGIDEKNAVKAIQASIDNGVNLIDTAPIYGMGLSEELVGKGIKGRREKVVLATKCGLVWHLKKGNHFLDYDEGVAVHRYLGSDSIRYELEKSLKLLNTDYIDLYQTHWQDSTTPIEETMSVLLDMKKEGKIRAIGVSNITIEELKEYKLHGQLDSDQEIYSMLDRGIEKDILPWCKENDVSVLAYSPLSRGLLTGKVDSNYEFKGDDARIEMPRFSIENRNKINSVLDKIRPFAEKYGITLAQLVIAWTKYQPGITHVLCGARNEKQAIENSESGNVKIIQPDVEKIESIISDFNEIIS